MDNTITIAIFAKAPIEGFAKTRLIPRLGARGAAELQRLMIEQTILTATESHIGPVTLWCAPDCNHDVFSLLAKKYAVDLHPQSGADLGARMLNAFDVLTPTSPVVVIGCDCPALQPTHLHMCAGALRSGSDAVFVPTEDGGYALVAAAKPWPELFRGIRWGSSSVMPETRSRTMRLGLRVSEPAILWDIDTPADFDRAAGSGLLTYYHGAWNTEWKV